MFSAASHVPSCKPPQAQVLQLMSGKKSSVTGPRAAQGPRSSPMRSACLGGMCRWHLLRSNPSIVGLSVGPGADSFGLTGISEGA